MKRYKSPADIKVGCIGYGGAFNMGQKHLAEMARAGMVPTAVAEIDPARLEVAVKDYPGIETYGSVAEMLRKSEVQLLAVITPHNTHFPLAMQCLKAGRHVVLEKPMAVTTAECDKMIALARQKGVVVSTYHNRHWDGHILQAVEEIKQQKLIGEVVRIEARMGGYSKPGDWWRTSKTMSGGILYDWGVHLLEYSLQLIDSDITEVSGFAHHGFWGPQTKWKDDAIEDEGFAVVRFKSGQWLTLRITTLENNPKPGFLEITGTLGGYAIDWDGRRIYRKDGGDSIISHKKHPPAEGHKLYQNIADHLTRGEKLIITGEWARRPIHVLDLAVQSARKGVALKAKYK